MPRHNGKVERYQPDPGEELLYAQVWDLRSPTCTGHSTFWNIHYNTIGTHRYRNQPPAQRLHAGVTNVMASNIYPWFVASGNRSAPRGWPRTGTRRGDQSARALRDQGNPLIRAGFDSVW